MRLAWFSPWPPDRSGVAGRSAELVPLLAARGAAVDVFVDERRFEADGRADASAPPPGTVRRLSAHDYVWRQSRHGYDLTVYQVGNSRLHEYIWPYLFRWPGLAVLHDARLHHARGRALLSRGRTADYRAEFAWSHPDVNPNLAELAVAGYGGPYYYQWPMVRGVLAASRLVAVHARGARAELREAWPDHEVEYIALGEGRSEPVTDSARLAQRSALGLDADLVAFGVFGGLTAEKRIEAIAEAFASTHARLPNTRLVLAGTPEHPAELQALLRQHGIADAARVVDAPGDDDFDQLIAAVDVSLNLRWPSALETSGPWLRAMAASRPTVVLDLAHISGLPALDPRTWAPHPGSQGAPPIAVAIDILDEVHSLRQAMSRLAVDAALRAELGHRARLHWEQEHSVARMADDYTRVMGKAAGTPLPVTSLPSHIRPEPASFAIDLLSPFGRAVVEAAGLEARQAG